MRHSCDFLGSAMKICYLASNFPLAKFLFNNSTASLGKKQKLE